MASSLEKRFLTVWTKQWGGIIPLESEISIIPDRKFQFDLIHSKSKTAIELNGRGGGHSTFKGLDRDYTKLNLAIIEGWQVFQLSPPMLTREWIKKIGDYILAKEQAEVSS